MRKKVRSRTQKSRQGIGAGISLCIYISVIAVVSMAAAFFTQVVQNGDLGFTAAWLSENFGIFIVNSFVMAALITAVSALTGDLFIGLSIFTLLTFLCSYISYFKSRYIGEPLFPWDLIGIRELFNSVKGVLETKHFIPLVICIAVCTATAFIGKIIRLRKFGLINRICIFIVALLMVFAVCFYQLPGVSDILNTSGVSTDMENENLRYQQNGFMLSFFMNIQDVYIAIPENYKSDRILRMADQIKLLAKSTDITEPPEELPDIITVVNCSFWDSKQLVNFRYSEDPLTNFRLLEEQGYVKKTVTPQLGSKTCNAEYELLTGLSQAYLPQGSVPYLQYISSSIPCLPDYLKAFGYKTIAICAGDRNFWNRDEIYEYMKFDTYISAEDFETAGYEMRDGKPTDAAMADMIISQYEAAGGSVFIFAVTAEDDNYAKQVYNDGKDGNAAIKVTGTTYSKHNQALSAYLQNLREADAQLGQLTEYFGKEEGDVRLVFTGDHLPVFDGYSGIFADGGLVQSAFSYRWSTEELLKMHTLPIVLWCNTPVAESADEPGSTTDPGDAADPDEPGSTTDPGDTADPDKPGSTDNPDDPADPDEPDEEKLPTVQEVTAKYMCDSDSVSMWLVPSIILDWCKIPMNPWYKQIWRRGEVISVYINGAVADGDGNIYDSVTEDMEATYAAYEMMNYDILFGNRYSKKYLYTKPSDEQKTAEP